MLFRLFPSVRPSDWLAMMSSYVFEHSLARSSSCHSGEPIRVEQVDSCCLLSSDWLLGAGWKLGSEVSNTMLTSSLSSISYEADSREVMARERYT